MSTKYDKYIHHPPHLRLSMKSDKSVVFDGLMIGHQQLGYDFTIGHQFVTKPFKGDNPCHTHNFQEFIAWYGTNPEDPKDFGGEVVIVDQHLVLRRWPCLLIRNLFGDLERVIFVHRHGGTPWGVRFESGSSASLA